MLIRRGTKGHSFIHLFCKKQLTERNCTTKNSRTG